MHSRTQSAFKPVLDPTLQAPLYLEIISVRTHRRPQLCLALANSGGFFSCNPGNPTPLNDTRLHSNANERTTLPSSSIEVVAATKGCDKLSAESDLIYMRSKQRERCI